MSRTIIPALARFWQRVLRALPPSRGGRLAFVVLFGTGVFLRLAGLDWGVPPRDNAASFYHDEGHVLAFVLADWKTFRASFGEYEVVRPVFFWRLLGRPLFRLGDALGWNDPATRVYEFAVLRGTVALMGIAGLFGVYLLGRRMGGSALGLWALAFLSVIPGHWYYSQILKGDLMVATFFTFLLLAAMRIVERGDTVGYLWAGVLMGAGTALKPTVLVSAPVLLLAHGIRSWRVRRPSAVIGVRPLAALALSIVSFLLLYPYPFLDAGRLWKLLREPTSQSFALRFDLQPDTYARLWRAYTESPRVFVSLVYGRFLQAALVPAVVLAGAVGVWQWRRKRSWALPFSLLLALLFFHSLTFTDPLDDRYILPAAPLVALFAAVGTLSPSLVGFRHAGARVALKGLGGVVLVGTAVITAVTFPLFALRDPREEAVAWVTSQASPNSLVAQPVILSRWSLVFDRSRVRDTSLMLGADTTRHVARLTHPAYVVVQREPWNYDHTFRYELEGVRESFAEYLKRFTVVRTFGREPALFGLRLPRNLGMPVIDVYQPAGELAWQRVAALQDSAGTTMNVRGFAVTVFPRSFTAEELRGAFTRVTVDLRGLRSAWREEGDRVRVGLLALWDGQEIPHEIPDLPREPAFLTRENAWGWIAPLAPADLQQYQQLTLVLDHPQDDIWDVYDGFNGTLMPRSTGRRDFSTVRFALVAIGRSDAPGTPKITEAFVARPREL